MQPHARRNGLVVGEIGDEVVVYDMESQKVSCLNRTTALVWRQCDGKTNPGQMGARLEAELAIPIGEPVVQMALARLHATHLLEGISAKQVKFFSRREWGAQVSRLGLSVTVLPTIVSILAPTAAEAQSAISMMACSALMPPCPGTPCVMGGSCMASMGGCACL